jgi:hypothetical protein
MIIIVCTIISILCTRQEEYLLDIFRSKCLNKNGKCVLTKCYIVVFKSTTFEERMGGKIIHV